MSPRNRAIAYLAVLLLVATFVILTAKRADANTQYALNGSDVSWVTHGYTANSGGTQEHRVISLNDDECDGHTAYVQFELQNTSNRITFADGDGCGGSSYQKNYTSTGKAITWFRVGEKINGTVQYSRWVRVHSHIYA